MKRPSVTSLTLLLTLLVIQSVIHTTLYMKSSLSYKTITYSTTENKEENISTACTRRYILLSTQRSGSTWVCDLLNHQQGITCGGLPNNKATYFHSELLKEFLDNRTDAEIEWSEYEKALERAFAIACKSKSALSFGFKLMYNQIPPQFLEDEKFESYLRENNVSIIHLVREAKILKIASLYTAQQQSEWHAWNETDAAKTRDTPKLSWNDKIIEKMLKLENESLNWQKKLQFMFHVPIYYLSYESLLNKKDMVEAFRQISGFLTNTIPDSSTITTDFNYFQLHEPLCSDRIEDYENFRAHDKIRESRSATACDMIELLNNV